MADSSPEPQQEHLEATNRFSLRQRASISDAPSSAFEAHRDALPSPWLPPTSTSPANVLDGLEAFLNSREEDAVDMLAFFTHLTEQDKTKALEKLEGGVSENDEDIKEKRKGASKPVAQYGELRRRLQERERQQQQQAKQFTTRHVDVNDPRSNSSNQHTNVHAAKTSPGGDVSHDDLEVVELEEGTHTGNLVAFFDKGVTDVPTSFDNFFGTESEASHRHDRTAAPTATTVASPPVLEAKAVGGAASSPFSLDELLAVEEAVESSVAVRDAACTTPPSSPTAAKVDGTAAASSASSEVGSVELPGLEDEEDEKEVRGEEVSDNATENAGRSSPATQHVVEVGEKAAQVFAAEVAEGLHAVIAEHNDCVQSFALDPLFDYDADVLGEAFRSGREWRR